MDTTGTLGWVGDTVTMDCGSYQASGGPTYKVMGASLEADGQLPSIRTRLSEDGSRRTVEATDWPDGAAPVGIPMSAACVPDVRVFGGSATEFGMIRAFTVTQAGQAVVFSCPENFQIRGNPEIRTFPSTVSYSKAPTGDGGWKVTVDSIGDEGAANLNSHYLCERCP